VLGYWKSVGMHPELMGCADRAYAAAGSHHIVIDVNNSVSWGFEGILVGISCRPIGMVELEISLQQKLIFAADYSFRIVEVV